MKKHPLESLSLENKICKECGAERLLVYVLSMSGVTCFRCHAKLKIIKKDLIDSMQDVESMEPMSPFFYLTDLIRVDQLWDNPLRSYWEH